MKSCSLLIVAVVGLAALFDAATIDDDTYDEIDVAGLDVAGFDVDEVNKLGEWLFCFLFVVFSCSVTFRRYTLHVTAIFQDLFNRMPI